MAFLVYLFVLVVAAGSIVFGLDLTQSPLKAPSYATPAAQATDSAPTVAPAKIETAAGAPASRFSSSTSTKRPVESVGVAANARASSEEAHTKPAAITTTTVSAPNHCAIDACAAAYKSFRASDCTYQPYGGGRRLCAKTGTSAPTKKVAAAARHANHAVDFRRSYDRRYAERDDDRDSYVQPRRGWAFDLFGR
jgi:hypothetical protein